MAAITRGKLIRADQALYDGKTLTASRPDATGGTTSGLVVDNTVDVLQVFGDGVTQTDAAISAALSRIGSSAATLVFAPGTWTISVNVTIPANIVCIVPAGAIFSVDSGKTLTFSGSVHVDYPTSWTSGSGTVTVSKEGIHGGVLLRTAAEAAVSFTPTNYRYLPGNVLRGATVGDGVANDKTAIQAVINTGHNIVFPDGKTYFLGTQDSGAFLTPAVDGQVFIFEDGATLKGNGNTGVTNTASIFFDDGKSHITLINPRFESNWGVDADRDVPYAIGLGCAVANTRNITLINPIAYKCQALVQAVKETYNDTFEVEDVDLINGYADNCYYGTGWARTGNNVRAFYKTLNAHRAYFPYGVHTHDIQVFDEQDGTVTGPTTYLHSVLIQATSFTGSIAAKDTYGIRLRYTVKGAQYTGIPFIFHIDHLAADTKKGVLRDIHVTYNDRGTGISKSIGFVYLVDNVTTASYTGTAWDRITLDGHAKNPFDLTNAGVLGAAVAQTVPGTLDIGGLEMNAAPTGVNNPHNGTLFDSGRLFDDAQTLSFTPVVKGSSAAGAGTYTIQQGVARKRGRNVTFDMIVAWTAHTGTGDITIDGLPYTVKNLANYSATANIAADSLTFTGQLAARLLSNETLVRVYVVASGAAIAALAIDTAATLWISGSFETN